MSKMEPDFNEYNQKLSNGKSYNIEDCPLNGECLTDHVVYRAEFEAEGHLSMNYEKKFYSSSFLNGDITVL